MSATALKRSIDIRFYKREKKESDFFLSPSRICSLIKSYFKTAKASLMRVNAFTRFSSEVA